MIGLAFEEEVRGDLRVLIITGDVDLRSVSALESQIDEVLASGCRYLGLDFRHTRFMGSEGPHLLIRIARRMRMVGGELYVVGASPAVRRVMSVLGLGTVLP